jgi:hypothetical protein
LQLGHSTSFPYIYDLRTLTQSCWAKHADQNLINLRNL